MPLYFMHKAVPTESWYYQLAGATKGPVTETTLHEEVREGRQPPDVMVRQTSQQEWQPYEDVFDSGPPTPDDEYAQVCCFVCQEYCPRAAASLVLDRWVCVNCRPLQNANMAPARIWSHHHQVIMSPEAELPPRCVICNALVTRWIKLPIQGAKEAPEPACHAGVFFSRILFRLLVRLGFTLLALLSGHKQVIKLNIGLCAQHHQRRIRRRWVLGGSIAFGTMLHALSTSSNSQFLYWMAIALFCGSFFYAIVSRLRIKIHSESDGYLCVSGCRPQFLNSLAPWKH